LNHSNERKNGAILSYIVILVNTFVQLLYTPILIKKLGQSEYGLFSLVESIIGYLTILDFGFGNAIIVYTAKYRAQEKYDEEKKLHGMFFAIFCLIALLAGTIGIILLFNVDNIFGRTMSIEELSKMKIMMLILTFNLFFTFIFSIYTSIITAYERFTFRKLTAIISSILKPLIMVPLLFLGFKSITLAIVITCINIVILLSNYLYCKKKLNISIKFQGFEKNVFKEVFGYSFFIFLGEIVDKANWSVDNFVLGSVSGTIAVSVYSVASTLNKLFIHLSTAISGVLLPKMSKLVSKNADSNILTCEFIKVGRIQFYVIFVMICGLILFGKNFIQLWAGEEYTLSYYVALILIIPLCFPLIQNLGLSIMQAMNKYKFKSISTAIMAVFNIIISIFLAQKWGAIGAAMGTALALIICNILIINIYYYKVIKIDVIAFWKDILKLFVKLVPSVLMTILFMNVFAFYGVKAFIMYGIFFVACFAINLITICLNDYEKQLINNIIKRLHIKELV
jgi:O-antigen/teichoic acid export membrane protein